MKALYAEYMFSLCVCVSLPFSCRACLEELAIDAAVLCGTDVSWLEAMTQAAAGNAAVAKAEPSVPAERVGSGDEAMPQAEAEPATSSIGASKVAGAAAAGGGGEGSEAAGAAPEAPSGSDVAMASAGEAAATAEDAAAAAATSAAGDAAAGGRRLQQALSVRSVAEAAQRAEHSLDFLRLLVNEGLVGPATLLDST